MEYKPKRMNIKLFWDIENVTPSAKNVVNVIREIQNKLKFVLKDAYVPPDIIIVCNARSPMMSIKLCDYLHAFGADIHHINTRKPEAADKHIERLINRSLREHPNAHYGIITHDNDFSPVMRIIKENTTAKSKLFYICDDNCPHNVFKLKLNADHIIYVKSFTSNNNYVKVTKVAAKPKSPIVKPKTHVGKGKAKKKATPTESTKRLNKLLRDRMDQLEKKKDGKVGGEKTKVDDDKKEADKDKDTKVDQVVEKDKTPTPEPTSAPTPIVVSSPEKDISKFPFTLPHAGPNPSEFKFFRSPVIFATPPLQKRMDVSDLHAVEKEGSERGEKRICIRDDVEDS